jgi:uncharacterized membrane protein
MSLLIIGLLLFFGIHSVSIINSAWRNHVVAKIGQGPWQGIYSVIAVVGFILIVQGFALARHDAMILYQPPLWLRHVTLLLMVFAFPLLFATYLPGRIKTATKHPMLAATKLWAFAHLLANGSLADIVLFGSFLAWAVLDRISMKWRPVPLPVPGTPPWRFNDALAVILGLGVYVAFLLWLHQWLFGVSPLA